MKLFINHFCLINNGDGLWNRWLFDHNRLHPTFQSPISFNIIMELIQSSCSNQLNISTCQNWFNNISCIECLTILATSANYGMKFIYKEKIMPTSGHHLFNDFLEFNNKATVIFTHQTRKLQGTNR